MTPAMPHMTAWRMAAQIGVQGGEPEGQTAGKPVDREKGQQRAGQDQQEPLEKQMPHAVERPRAVLADPEPRQGKGVNEEAERRQHGNAERAPELYRERIDGQGGEVATVPTIAGVRVF